MEEVRRGFAPVVAVLEAPTIALQQSTELTMPRVRLHPDWSTTVLDVGTPEEQAVGHDAILGVVEALGRLMAEEDYRRSIEARRTGKAVPLLD